MQIPGPAGMLQAELDHPHGDLDPIAVLCHPHPQYGGSMYDAVLATAAKVLLGRQTNCLRFNFRGVGQSEGTYDGGVGEVADLWAVHQWVAQSYPDAPILWLGYSFGANVVWHGLSQAAPATAVLIAPPVGTMTFEEIELPDTTVHAIAGADDDFVDTAKLDTLAGSNVVVLPGADHFFSGAHDALAAALTGL